MTRPLNLYSISRIHDETLFNIVETHQSQKDANPRTQYHEIESLRFLTDNLVAKGLTLEELDGFFFGFHIPQIGKEFDLLKFTKNSCLNIELKSQAVSEDQILNQLLKNRHYLSHLGKRLSLYTVVTDSMSCYKLSLGDELLEVDFNEIVTGVKKHAQSYSETIDEFFRASDYLVSPLTTPQKFIQGEYFLTQAQEQVKKEVLNGIGKAIQGSYFHITGKPGTGKTLLIYDIAKTLSKNGNTLIVHCGMISEGQELISKSIENLNIEAASSLRSESFSLDKYNFILVDESHRIYQTQFNKIINSVCNNDQVCIFSSDPEQVLSSAEKRRDIVSKIKKLPLSGEFPLSEKIRTNKELHSFIMCLKNLVHKPKVPINYLNVEINYANTTAEAQNLLAYYRAKMYMFINYSKSIYYNSPYSEYEEDFDTHHVIGKEFDKVVMLMDSSFYYDENGTLQGIPHPNPDYLYPNLFYQGITRVREKLALVIVNAPDLFKNISSIIS